MTTFVLQAPKKRARAESSETFLYLTVHKQTCIHFGYLHGVSTWDIHMGQISAWAKLGLTLPELGLHGGVVWVVIETLTAVYAPIDSISDGSCNLDVNWRALVT